MSESLLERYRREVRQGVPKAVRRNKVYSALIRRRGSPTRVAAHTGLLVCILDRVDAEVAAEMDGPEAA